MSILTLLSAVALLTASQVGPDVMPEQIEPVVAPFETQSFSRPVFPDRTRKVWMRRGGRMSTRRIQRVIDRVSRRGGGTVVIPAGVWYTGRICLKNDVNLHISEGAELHFSGEIKDYLPVVFTRDEGVELYSLGAYIYANGARHIALTGKGRIISPDDQCEIYRRNSDDPLGEVLTHDLPDRIYDGRDGGHVFIPKAFAPINCENVFVEGLTFENRLYWNIVPQYCQHVVIRGCTVSSVGHTRTDGIDIDSCKDVLVEYCSLDDEDDCFTFKSGRGEDGRKVNRSTERVVIRRCLALRGGGGIVFGTEIAGGVRDVYLHDCVFRGTDHAVRFKTRRPRGGFVENVTVERVTANVKHQALWAEMLGSERWVGELAHRYPAREITPLTPWFRNFTIRDMEITGCETLVDMAGLPEMPLRNVSISNITAKCGQVGSFADAENISMKNVNVETDDLTLTLDNVRDASFADIQNVSLGKAVKIVTLPSQQ
ncbi:MAG: glycoside hydrolase family 28 protein [Bacteroidales bacterium]|nr:glycoside hydrolase family 28 protein [Bacteroidales bacterium]